MKTFLSKLFFVVPAASARCDSFQNERTLRNLFITAFAILGGLSLFELMGWDQLNFHYLIYKMRRFGQLPYRDFYDPNFPGIFLYHWFIHTIFGESDFSFRLFDLFNTLFLCFTIYKTLGRLVDEVHKSALYLSLLLVVTTYYGVGWWWTGQREALLLPYIWWSFFLTLRCLEKGRLRDGFFSGALSAVAFCIKPYYGFYLPAFLLIYLVLGFPHRGHPIRTRLLSCVSAGLGFLSIVSLVLLILYRVDILQDFSRSFLAGMQFKAYHSSTFWNMSHVVFGGSWPNQNKIYSVFHVLLLLLALGHIGHAAFIGRFSKIWGLSFLLLFSPLLIELQANGEVMNHHIPFTCFKAIAAALSLDGLARWSLAKIRIDGQDSRNPLRSRTAGMIQILMLCTLCLVLSHKHLTLPIYALMKRDISIERYQSSQYQTKNQEDFIIQYIKKNVHLDHEEVMFFCFSSYMAYHSGVRTFSKLHNNNLFIVIPPGLSFRETLANEMARDFSRKPPALVVVQTDDTWWARATSFKHWSTSAEEIKKLGGLWSHISSGYQVAFELPSFRVYCRAADVCARSIALSVPNSYLKITPGVVK